MPLVWIVLNNRSLQIERELMVRNYGRETFCDYRNSRGELWNPDVGQWATAMGAASFRVDTADAYAPALCRAIELASPVVIDVAVSLEVQGYRQVWYPYPADFYKPWCPGPEQISEV